MPPAVAGVASTRAKGPVAAVGVLGDPGAPVSNGAGSVVGGTAVVSGVERGFVLGLVTDVTQ